MRLPRRGSRQRRVTLEITRLKRELKSGRTNVLVGNIAVAYRALGNRRRAYAWWRKAAALGDGDALVEVGYCLQYGIGVRREPAAAMKAYRDALRSRSITPHGLEEALYHLAIAHVDLGGSGNQRRAIALLQRASADGDYPSASRLLTALDRGEVAALCRCRRSLRDSLGGRERCRFHGQRGK